METIDKILILDDNFIKIENQTIIDKDLTMFQEFENSRNALVSILEKELRSNKYTLEQKKEMVEKFKNSNSRIVGKFDEIKFTIKQNSLKSQYFKNAYPQKNAFQGSFFIDKSV